MALPPRLSTWILRTFAIFETVFLCICAAYLFGGLAKDRIAARYRRASLIDPRQTRRSIAPDKEFTRGRTNHGSSRVTPGYALRERVRLIHSKNSEELQRAEMASRVF